MLDTVHAILIDLKDVAIISAVALWLAYGAGQRKAKA